MKVHIIAAQKRKLAKNRRHLADSRAKYWISAAAGGLDPKQRSRFYSVTKALFGCRGRSCCFLTY